MRTIETYRTFGEAKAYAIHEAKLADAPRFLIAGTGGWHILSEETLCVSHVVLPDGTCEAIAVSSWLMISSFVRSCCESIYVQDLQPESVESRKRIFLNVVAWRLTQKEWLSLLNHHNFYNCPSNFLPYLRYVVEHHSEELMRRLKQNEGIEL